MFVCITMGTGRDRRVTDRRSSTMLTSLRTRSHHSHMVDFSCFVEVFCLSNRKFERLGGPVDEIVTVFVHKYNVIMPHPNITS